LQKKYGFAPLGDANSVTKQLIFAGNATKFYKIKLKAALGSASTRWELLEGHEETSHARPRELPRGAVQGAWG
jgi:hypothetical protein